MKLTATTMKMSSIHWKGSTPGSPGKGRRRLKKVEKAGMELRTRRMVLTERRRRASEET